MNIIVAVDNNWGIGYNNKLLQIIPEDMRLFKQLTYNKIVIMGRETFESLPNKQPLKNRINIVLSRDKEFIENNSNTNNQLIIYQSLDELFARLKNVIYYNSDKIFIIGGESIYKQFLPYCDKAYITKINREYKADRYFVNLDESEGWKLVFEGENRYFDVNGSENVNDFIEYRFLQYKNNNNIERSKVCKT